LLGIEVVQEVLHPAIISRRVAKERRPMSN